MDWKFVLALVFALIVAIFALQKRRCGRHQLLKS